MIKEKGTKNRNRPVKHNIIRNKPLAKGQVNTGGRAKHALRGKSFFSTQRLLRVSK